MKKLFLCFLILISCTTYASDLPGNPADDTKQQSLDRFKQHLSRQDAYARRMEEVKASIGKDSQGRQTIQQIVNKHAVLPDGSKAELKTVVTQTPNKTKVAQVLTERLKNAKDYAKNLGKASIPSFVGMAAFHGLMEGIDWVMDEGGEIQKKNPELEVETTVQPYHQYRYVFSQTNQIVASVEALRRISNNYFTSSTRTNCSVNTSDNRVYCNVVNNDNGSTGYFSYGYRELNPSYNPSAVNPNPSHVNVSSSELQTAVKNALESNNAALAAVIADAIKSAYSYDGSEGQKPSSNTLAKEAADDMAVALPKAFDNPVPTSNPDRPSGYYKITDGDKTVEGYVTPAPISGTTDTTTTPTIDPVTGQPTGGTSTTGGFQLPAFCDWAAVVCDFIDWVKEEPEIDEPEVPFKDIQRQEIRDDLLTIGSTACPADIQVNWTGLPFGISIDKTVEMRPYCDVLEPLKYVFSLLTICLCAFMFLRL